MAMGRMGQILGHTFDVVNGNSNGSTHDLEDVLVNNEYYPVSGSYIDVSGAERVHVLVELGTLADAITFELYEAEAADGTEDQISATYYKHTCVADDDGEFAVITIETNRLSKDHHFLTTKVAAVSGTNYATITYLLEVYGDLPPTSTALPTASQHYYTG